MDINDYEDPRPTAAQSWKSTRFAMKLVGRTSRADIDAEMSRNILQGDLGQFRDEGNESYFLDDDAKDRLLAHARQDAAHSVLIALRVEKKLAQMRWLIFVAIALLLLVLTRI